MTFVAIPERYDHMRYNRVGRSGLKLPALSLGLWHNFGARPSARHAARDRPARVRPRHHALRPREQLRPAGRQRRGELRPPARDRPRALSRRAHHLVEGRATTCGRVRTATSARASTCSHRSTRASAGSGSTTSTSSTRTAPTPRRRSRRRWAPSPAPCARARRSTSASRTTTPSRPARPRQALVATRACRCSSTSRATRCSTGTSRTACSRLLEEVGAASIVFSPLAQGLLTDRYLVGRRARRLARGRRAGSSRRERSAPSTSSACADWTTSRRNAGRASRSSRCRGCCGSPLVASALIGASSVAQLEQNVAALDAAPLDDDEIAASSRSRRTAPCSAEWCAAVLGLSRSRAPDVGGPAYPRGTRRAGCTTRGAPCPHPCSPPRARFSRPPWPVSRSSPSPPGCGGSPERAARSSATSSVDASGDLDRYAARRLLVGWHPIDRAG